MNKNIKKQDIPVIAGIIFEAYVRNKADFVGFSSFFGGTFEADMGAAIKAVIDRRRPSDVSDKKKMVTIEVYKTLDELQEQLRLLGEYVKLAENDLLTPYSGYHIKRARKELQKKNVEGVLEHCEVIVDKIVNDDAVALAAMDFDAGKLAAFEAKMLELREMNREQVHKVNERQDVKATEDALFAALFDFVSKVSSVGKAMYTYKHKQRFSDFSVSKILGQINHGRKKKVVDDVEGEVAPVYDVMIGKVTDKMTDEPLENVVVRLEGTEIMVDTDEDGEFYLDDIPSGVYTVSFSKRGYVVGEQHNVEVGTSEMAELRVELVAD
jgi:Carboxypeptidase regulatory-like domain